MQLIIRYIFCLLWLNSDSQINKENCVNYTKNKIIGDSMSLAHICYALDSLQSHTKKNISIVHIGDSHIQADYFSGMLRVLFQEKFGNAGRGLIFPYKVAHTNEPINYYSSSTTEWLGVRNVLNPNHEELGISGISLFSKSNSANLSIQVKNQRTCHYAFNHVEIFSDKVTFKNMQVKNSISQTQLTSFLTSYTLKDTTHNLSINFSNQSPAVIHGIVLKNDSNGVLYHTIGVNGATFKSYNKTTLFAEQLKQLHADLIVISLGTNESYDAKFDSIQFKQELQEFVTTIKTSCPNCSILFTTPADNFKVHKKKAVHNSKPKLITKLINEYAASQHYATWNLYEIMGGKGSMKVWNKNKLATKDLVHFTRKGYELQGKLLFDALIANYENGLKY